MTHEEQRIAIAEACGWERKEVFERSFTGKGHHVSRGFKWHDPNGNERNRPDYLSDLNAMHEAEKVLTPEQRTRYVQVLCLLNNKEMVYQSQGVDHYFYIAVHTTAAQRAEAFLRTIGKWQDLSPDSTDRTVSSIEREAQPPTHEEYEAAGRLTNPASPSVASLQEEVEQLRKDKERLTRALIKAGSGGQP